MLREREPAPAVGGGAGDLRLQDLPRPPDVRDVTSLVDAALARYGEALTRPDEMICYCRERGCRIGPFVRVT